MFSNCLYVFLNEKKPVLRNIQDAFAGSSENAGSLVIAGSSFKSQTWHKYAASVVGLKIDHLLLCILIARMLKPMDQHGSQAANVLE